MHYFKDLPISGIEHSIVILDIDGTVVADGGSELSQEVFQKIQELTKHNFVYFLSNKNLPERNSALATLAGIEHIKTLYKKPNKKILEDFFIQEGMPVIVIGDKWLTDGLFAQNIGARFIKVKRMKGGGIVQKVVNICDDVLYWLHMHI